MLKKESLNSLVSENMHDFVMRKNKEVTKQKALDRQVGGKHYKHCGIQPVEYIKANNLDYLEGNIVKYITRHRTKSQGREDIKKVIHYAQFILEFDYPEGE